jgi:hypothetical protein
VCLLRYSRRLPCTGSCKTAAADGDAADGGMHLGGAEDEGDEGGDEGREAHGRGAGADEGDSKEDGGIVEW